MVLLLVVVSASSVNVAFDDEVWRQCCYRSDGHADDVDMKEVGRSNALWNGFDNGGA